MATLAPSVQLWRVLMDTRSPWLSEFARALSISVEAKVYSPDIEVLGRLTGGKCREAMLGELRVWRFPLQRGYFSPYVAPLTMEDGRIAQWLDIGDATEFDPLICCMPHYARVAEKWPGPVVYYATDLFRAYEGWDAAHIKRLERRMCRAATIVCPNSMRVAEVFLQDGLGDPNRIIVVPNAVRAENLLSAPARAPFELPADVAELKRPVAGVIGNLGENTDWLLLEEVVQRAPWLSWIFVGPYSSTIQNTAQADARQRLLRFGRRVQFTGRKDPDELKHYARAVDVAVLPYRKREPTYSGSSTRFYEHLAACRPIIATRGFEELLHKEPLLRLVDTAEEFVTVLESLRDVDFQDGMEEARWRASSENTWEVRARHIELAIEKHMQSKVSAGALRADR